MSESSPTGQDAMMYDRRWNLFPWIGQVFDKQRYSDGFAYYKSIYRLG